MSGDLFEDRIAYFCTCLCASVDIDAPRIQTGVPITDSAQYSSVTETIQYADDVDMLMTLIEKGSSAPLRWTLHELAHHIQKKYNVSLAEDFAIRVESEYVSILEPDWRAIVREGTHATTPQFSMDIIKLLDTEG